MSQYSNGTKFLRIAEVLRRCDVTRLRNKRPGDGVILSDHQPQVSIACERKKYRHKNAHILKFKKIAYFLFVAGRGDRVLKGRAIEKTALWKIKKGI